MIRLLMLLSLGGAAAAHAQAPLTIGRLHYDGGGDWYANPSSLPNLLAAIRERTALRSPPRSGSSRLADDELWDVPYLYMTGHGNVRFSRRGARDAARAGCAQGGFLHADDNYGMDESIRRELAPAVSRPRAGRGAARPPGLPPGLRLSARAFPRSTSTTASRPRGSASFSTAGWSSSTPIRPISATAGRIPRCTTIPPRSARRRSAWA